MENLELEAALAALRRDYAKLLPRIRTLEHTISCESDGVILRLHFPSFRQGRATIQELTNAIAQFLIQFAMPRAQVEEVNTLYGRIGQDDFIFKYNQLNASAQSLFKQANKATNRNGEAGELLLYLLTEWILGAPQLIAKMSLKTNREMPIHGADGVHIRYCNDTQKILMYWGESKLYSNVSTAISSAIDSIIEALDPDKLKHEIDLVKRNIDFSGLDFTAKQHLLRYFDPFDESYNERHDITTCLIGFDFDKFDLITEADVGTAEGKFSDLARTKLTELAPHIAAKIKDKKLVGRPIEFFFFPVPSVQDFRDKFQAIIGWNK